MHLKQNSRHLLSLFIFNFFTLLHGLFQLKEIFSNEMLMNMPSNLLKAIDSPLFALSTTILLEALLTCLSLYRKLCLEWTWFKRKNTVNLNTLITKIQTWYCNIFLGQYFLAKILKKAKNESFDSTDSLICLY